MNNFEDKFWRKDSCIRSDLIVHPKLEQLIIKEINENQEKKILDVGCGNGKLMERLLKKNIDIVGIDQNDKYFPNNERYTKQRLPYLDFNDLTFDIIYSSMVFLFLSEKILKQTINEIYRILKDDGIFFVADVHPYSLINEQNNKLVKREKNLCYFKTKKTRTRLFNLEGKSIQIEHYHRTLEQYSKIFNNNGFTISEIIEPPPNPNLEKELQHFLITEYNQPSYIIFKLNKVD